MHVCRGIGQRLSHLLHTGGWCVGACGSGVWGRVGVVRVCVSGLNCPFSRYKKYCITFLELSFRSHNWCCERPIPQVG